MSQTDNKADISPHGSVLSIKLDLLRILDYCIAEIFAGFKFDGLVILENLPNLIPSQYFDH